ncbi:histidine kinase [Flammeovirgaceae bacterium 311]|nr:histidine kinase [Flammeovirgaceae bacterium 311]
MNKYPYLLLTLFLIIIHPLSAGAQDQALADSLITVLNTQNNLSDLDKYNLYYSIAQASVNSNTRIEYSTRAINIAKEKNLDVTYQTALVHLGIGHRQKGELVKAVEIFFQAAEQFKQLGKKGSLAAAYAHIAQTYRMQNHHLHSIKYYHMAIGIFREEKDTVRVASTLLNLGYQYLKFNKPDSALIPTLEAETMFRAVGFEQGVAYALGNSGLMYAALQQDRKAENKLKEAIAILEKLHDEYAITEYLIEIAAIYQSRQEYSRALSYAKQGYALAENNKYMEFLRDASQRLSEIHAAMGQHNEAFNFLKKHNTYRDSLINEEAIRKMADLRTDYELAQKQADIDRLEVEKNNQQLMLAALLITLLLGSAVIFLLIKYNRGKKRANVLLAKQKQELEKQRNQLAALDHTRSKLFSIISHDLRGPVNSFNGISSLIKHYISTNDLIQLAEISQYIDSSASELSSLLDNLLSWSVSQRGEFPYKPEKVFLKPLTAEILGIFKTMAHAKKIKLESSVPADIALWADSNSLLTVLRNLTSNALKFTKEGGSVQITAAAKGAFAEIKVTDTGIGVSKKQLESLSDFNEEKRTWGTAGEKGLGIGLKLVFEFTRMNNGSVEVSSQEGIGTTFCITLPLYDAARHAKVQNMKNS